MYSIEDTTVNPAENSGKTAGKKQKPALRVGLSQLGELSRDFIKRIIIQRRKAPFCNFHDFCSRVKPGVPEIRILIRSGALDTFSDGFPRPGLFWSYFHLNKDNELFLLPPVPEFITDYPSGIKLRDEISTLGVLVSRHPLTIFSKRIINMRKKKPSFPLITSREIQKFINRRVCIAGLIVTGKEVITRDRDLMIFVSFEDPYSIYETVFFPESFHKHHHLLDGIGVYLIYGKVEEDQGALCINVTGLEKVSRRTGKC